MSPYYAPTSASGGITASGGISASGGITASGGISGFFKADPQPKAAPARAAKKLDDSLLTGKKPSADIDKRQQLATPG